MEPGPRCCQAMHLRKAVQVKIKFLKSINLTVTIKTIEKDLY